MTGLFGGSEQDALKLLKTDHRSVDELFSKVKANEDGNNKDVFTRIKEELDLHTHIEEQIFYPHLLENGDEELQKIVREGIEERLSAARRKAMMLAFARAAALRLQQHLDPGCSFEI